MTARRLHPFARAGLVPLALALSACPDRDREADLAEVPPAAAPPSGTPAPEPADDDEPAVTLPDEIYFDLTHFAWYREGRPIVHNGRSYLPQSDPIPVATELRKAGSYEGVAYYVREGAAEPVYTLYVPVYYRYWQRFTSPPGS